MVNAWSRRKAAGSPAPGMAPSRDRDRDRDRHTQARFPLVPLVPFTSLLPRDTPVTARLADVGEDCRRAGA